MRKSYCRGKLLSGFAAVLNESGWPIVTAMDSA